MNVAPKADDTSTGLGDSAVSSSRRAPILQGNRARLELQPREFRVKPVFGNQRLMRAFLDDLAIVDDEDAMRFEHSCEPMRDDERCPLGHQLFERRLYEDLVFGIESGGRLVEQKDRCMQSAHFS